MSSLWIILLAVTPLAVSASTLPKAENPYALPDGLLIGAGTSAIQSEGAWNEEGKGESAVDHLLHLGKLADLGYGDPHLHDKASDSYHRFREDVAMAAKLKLRVYRFSISWARVLPTADASKPNPLGVKFYHDLIDEILKYNMIPMATLYHFDHPLVLETEFKGWQSKKMVDKFEEYAKFAFAEYASKVNLWVLFNEPNMFCAYFNTLFVHAGMYKPEEGNIYRCIYNGVLAHAKGYRAFKDLGYQGQVGFTALIMHARPNSTRPEDVYTAEAFNQMHAGLALHAVKHGDFPEIVKELAVVPSFTEEEKKLIKGTADFFGFNVYYGLITSYMNPGEKNPSSNIPIFGVFFKDLPFVKAEIAGLNGRSVLELFSLIEPDAIRSCLAWAWETYKMPIIITENGMGEFTPQGLHDHQRAVYHSAFLRELVTVQKELNIDIRAYVAWSLIDSFEWSAGTGRPFGLVHVDFAGESLNRTLKDSHTFFTELAETRIVPVVEPEESTSTTQSPSPDTSVKPSSASSVCASLGLSLILVATTLARL